MKKQHVAATLFAALFTCATHAEAAIFQWKWSGKYSGSGTFVTDNSDGPPYKVEDVTGTFGGADIYSIFSLGEGDNILLSNPALVDDNGISFKANVPHTPGIFTFYRLDTRSVFIASLTSHTFDNGFLFAPDVPFQPDPISSAPEPASLGIVALALCSLAAWKARRFWNQIMPKRS